jgi:hypothetical protein
VNKGEEKENHKDTKTQRIKSFSLCLCVFVVFLLSCAKIASVITISEQNIYALSHD